MTASPEDSAVVICTYTDERLSQVLGAVDSVLAQRPPPGAVIVVVDHNPALLARLTEAIGASVLVVSNQERPGLSGARNTGVQHATGRHVVFLDDDARAEPGWLTSLLSPFADADVVGVGGLALPEWQTGNAPRWLPDEFLWVVGCHYRGHRVSSGPIRSPMGANMAFRRDAIVNAGGFAWQFSTPPFDRCDDTEMALRISSMTGQKIVFEPGAVVRHSVSPDRNRWSYFRRRCLLEGRAKAALIRRIGFQTATSSERRYLTSTLPRGVVRRLKNGLVRRDPNQFAQAATIAAGVMFSVAGFFQGTVIGWGRTASVSRVVFRELPNDQIA